MWCILRVLSGAVRATPLPGGEPRTRRDGRSKIQNRKSKIGTLVAPLLLAALPAGAGPAGLTFHASFDKQTATAEVAAGSGKSTLQEDLGFHSAPGVKGTGMLLQKGERCSYPIAGNFDTSQGTFSCWVKPVNWDGHSKKFRHVLVATPSPQYTMLVYLYPVGDEAVFNYIHLNHKTPQEATWRAGAPVDILPKGEWTHLVTTWDAKAVRIFANGKRVGEGMVAAPLPKIETGTFTLCPVDFWTNAQWGDPAEQTVCDEVRLFSRALTDDEILDLYALDVPGGAKDVAPALILGMKPDYFANAIAVTARPAHLDAGWKERVKGATLALTVRDPKGGERLAYKGPLGEGRFTARLPAWVDGDYAAEASLTAGGDALRGTAALTKPPTPWLPPRREWKADRVLEPWTPLARKEGSVRYWNGEMALPGALPAQITSKGEPLLAGPIRLVSGAPAVWDAPRVVEEKPFRVAVAGKGRLGQCTAAYETLMEFDGLVRVDVTLTPPAGGAEIGSLELQIPISPEVATFYRNPACRPWDGKALDEGEFLPYAWLGNDDRGLSWFMESAANWRIGKGQPAMSLRRERVGGASAAAEVDAVVVRLRLISEPVRLTKPLTYTFGFEATPVRPLSPKLYDWRFASGPQFKGSNLFVYGWGQQISALNARLIAHDPAGQRKLVDKWRANGQESLSYSCVQCTSNISPEYLFFAEEWNEPYGGTFSGYKRVGDNAPYSMVPVCPRSTFSDFLVWCAREHNRNDWGGGVYTDIDGAIPCDNPAHGCGYTDAFGQTGRTWPLYAHRAVSRRLYEACHDAGKVYFAHCHSLWVAPFNAFNDGWCPGEQYSSAVVGKPNFYMDDIPERVWRTEFASAPTGVATFMLPELGRLAGDDALKDPGPSECLIAAAMCYGVPLWAGSIHQRVVEDVWAAQTAFGIAGAEFVPYWRQREIASSDPEVRVSLWKKAGARLLVVANFSEKERVVELRPAAAGAGARYQAVWKADDLAAAGGAARLTVPAKRGALVTVSGLP